MQGGDSQKGSEMTEDIQPRHRRRGLVRVLILVLVAMLASVFALIVVLGLVAS